MKGNAIIPYILIMVLGIGLMVGLGIKGVYDVKKKGNDTGDAVESAAGVANGPEEIYAEKCISCHGDQYQGVVGPKLTDLSISEAEVKEILVNGAGSMPGNLVPEDQLDEMTEWLLTLK